ncbi:MAG: hypothetical protein J6Y78_04665 [Paludibacteraceae bacterium]|nr:hypothetical protein [Paludibacteraceae bacterium]
MVKFDYCDAQFRNIHFEGDNYLTEDELFELYDLVPVTDELPLFEVNIEKDGDDILVYIYIENDNVDECSDETARFLDVLSAREFDAFLSDEDYGGADVVVVNFTTEHLQICRKAIYERSLRVCPECGKKMGQFVAGQCAMGMEINQFHCNGCHYTWVGHPNGEFIREGVLLSEWEIRRMRGY